MDEASVIPRQEDSDDAELQIVTHSVVGSRSRKLKSSTPSSRASDRPRKAKAELFRREVELKNLLKCHEMKRQMENQIAEMKTQVHEF